MLTLYYKPTCPFSKKVLAVSEELGVELDLKNIKENSELTEELIGLGGKKQTPFLTDNESGVKLYESNDIIDYLNKNYSSSHSMAGQVRVHRDASDSSNICTD